jgi:phage terminase large subunit-like protein
MLRQELQRRITEAESGRYIDTLYPDIGPLRRELYAKHLEFWRAGAVHDERAFVAGNRCLTLATPVETDQGERRLEEIADGRDFGVVSWVDGSRQSARALPVFPVGIEPAFRLLLDNGQVVECSGRHRVLTVEGWLSLAQLVHRANGQRWWDAAPGYPASYDTGSHPDGPELRLRSGIAQGQLPSQGDVLTRARSSGSVGAAARRPPHTQICLACGRPSIRGVPGLREGRCGQWEQALSSSGAESVVLPCSGALRDVLRSGVEPFLPQGVDGLQWGRVHSLSLYGVRTEARVDADISREHEQAGQAEQLSGASSTPGCGALEWLHAAPGTAIFYPSVHPNLVGGQRIVTVTGIGCQQIVDFTVPGPRNYRAGGVIHHNTGKTTCVGFEDAVHLTGEYPPWWEGRRFLFPITCWACGTDSKAVREKLQPSLVGPASARGTGLIPRDRLLRASPRGGIPDAIDFAEVRHVSGGVSRLVFKAYEQGRESFQSAEVDVVQLDEEPPTAIYTEALTRTLSTVPGRRNGMVLCSFTPLEGISETVLQFLPGGAYPSTEALRKQAWGW